MSLRGFLALILTLLALLLAGCGSVPKGRDGPGANPPPGLANVPDAEPRVEAIRSGGPNRPYEVLGHSYVPITQDRPFRERGLASWYGRQFHGKRTANGEVYDMYAMTAAHPTLPLPSYARIRNPANGREVVVRVNDRGPFHAGRIVDLSYTAALKLDLLRGVAPVELERLTFEDIRTGAWRRDDGIALARAPAAAPVPAPAPLPAPAIDAPPPMVAAPPVVAVPPPVVAAPPPVVAALPPDDPAPAEALPDAPPTRPLASAERGWWIQLGAFRQREGAESFHRRVVAEIDWLAPVLGVFSDAALFRLQAGPYASRDEARAGAERVRETLQLVPLVVERK